MRGLDRSVRAAFDRHLLTGSRRPLAVAFSGGGDSLALLLSADDWARSAGRDLVVLTVDHRLQPQSAAWTAACGEVARRLGRPFRALAWEGEKPRAGLPAAARAARHGLLAEAAREAGAAVILMGHTADDVLEARAMRREGATTPEPRMWSPSPAWPEGRGVFLLRPLLGNRRAALRQWLTARGEAWIDDPANSDLRYARPRARAQIGDAAAVAPDDPVPLRLAEAAQEADGVVAIPRRAIREAAVEDARRFLAMASVCAGGGARRPAAARLERAAALLRGEGTVVCTLAGARLEADATTVRIVREPGEAARGGLASLRLPAGREVVWDGRFELTAQVGGLEVRRLAGLASKLSDEERRRLKAFPASARGGLPAVVGPGGVSSPLLAPCGVAARSLVGERLRAAAGLIPREPG